MGQRPVWIGVDVGGTKIAAGLVDDQGQLLHSTRSPSEAMAGRHAILERITCVCERMQQTAEDMGAAAQALGIASPGLINYEEGSIRFATSALKDWTGTKVVSALEDRLRLPVFLENDANAAALAESRMGAGLGHSDFLYISIGTGIGGGLILGRALHRGIVGGAGNFGHVAIDRRGPRCYCGSRGCVELYASAKALAAQMASDPQLQHFVSRQKPDRQDSEEERSEVRTLIALADEGNHRARELLAEAGRSIGVAAASTIHVINCGLVVVGGGVCHAGRWLMDPLEETIKHSVSPALAAHIAVKQARHTEHAGVLGAALVSREKLYSAAVMQDQGDD